MLNFPFNWFDDWASVTQICMSEEIIEFTFTGSTARRLPRIEQYATGNGSLHAIVVPWKAMTDVEHGRHFLLVPKVGHRAH